MQQLIIRPASAADAQDVARIYIDSWNLGFGSLMPTREVTAELVARWKEVLVTAPPHRWWIANSEDSIVGFAGIRPCRDSFDSDLGELDTIAIDPSSWRKGVGRALMAVSLHHLSLDGYREAILWTLARYERGQRFYEALGWQLDGGVRDEGRQVRYRHSLPAQIDKQHLAHWPGSPL